MTPSQEKILDNLDRAIAIITEIPDDKLDLRQFKTECGTIACTAGWLTSNPHFIQQGMGLAPTRSLYFRDVQPFDLTLHGKTHTNMDWLDDLFGPDAFDHLFIERGDGEMDEDIFHDVGDFDTSDKTLALERLKRRRNVLARLFGA